MRFVPMNEWSKDHFSLLAYVETCCVDGQGILDHDRMRTNIPRHPGMAGPRIARLPRGKGSYKYPGRFTFLTWHDNVKSCQIPRWRGNLVGPFSPWAPRSLPFVSQMSGQP